MNVQFWPHTTKHSVASYRIRCTQIRNSLATKGLRTALYNAHVWRHAPLALNFRPPSILVLSKRTKLKSLEHAIQVKERFGTKLVIDLCDNIYFSKRDDGYDQELSSKINQFDAVITASSYLREEVAKNLRKDIRISVIEDAVEAPPPSSNLQRMANKKAFQELSEFRAWIDGLKIPTGRKLVWYGVSGKKDALNGMFDLAAFKQKFEDHHAEKHLSLTIISNDRNRYRDLFSDWKINTFYMNWNYFTVNSALKLHDIAVLPIRPNGYSLSKSPNRLTSAINNGLAVCASSIPSYEPFRESAVLDDWDKGLAQLMESAELRANRVQIGRKLIESNCNMDAIGQQWLDLLQEVHLENLDD